MSISDFTLFRRFGKGSFGQVFAARKEDTMGLFALKMMPLAHAANRRGRHHLRVERQMLERAAMAGSPFLCRARSRVAHRPAAAQLGVPNATAREAPPRLSANVDGPPVAYVAQGCTMRSVRAHGSCSRCHFSRAARSSCTLTSAGR